MARMLQNPQFASMLNEALSNPSVVDMMIQQNPMLQNMGPQVRQMLQSPEFRRMMTDPEQLRSMMAMQRAMGLGGAGGASAFPAPGNTDDAPSTERTSAPPQGGQRQPPGFGMFGGGGAGAQAGNPFAALFNPAAFGNTPAQTPPPSASAGQPSTPAGGTERAGQTTGDQQQFNPMAANPFLQNPEAMRQFLRAMNPSGGSNDAPPDYNANNPFASLLGQLGGAGGLNPYGMPGGGGQTAAPVDTRPPEERYEEQLRQLNDMGFFEFDRNIEALRRSGGSVQGAIEYLLNH